MKDLISQLNIHQEEGLINGKTKNLIFDFYESYKQAIQSSPLKEKGTQPFERLVELIIERIQSPYSFSIFHQSIRHPFDYYQFGIDFIRPFIDFQQSQVFGLSSLKKIQEQLKRKENVILLANHQTEPDPQIINLLLEKIDPALATQMIFIAGHRVISDPLAIPLSLGCNLLCIYSKKHMSHPPEEKEQKVLHNQRTLKKMQELLNQGGCCIYVAPSGGRDRPNLEGRFDVAPFDAQSIELFWLMGQQSEHLTHFYPLALKTYPLMPPPRHLEKELGEKRTVNFTPVYLAFGEEVDMENFDNQEKWDKKTKRTKRAEFIWHNVQQDYRTFPKYSFE